MLLYRGTSEPQEVPLSQKYECVFFSPDFTYAADYAVGERGYQYIDHGFVQQYRLPKQHLLDIGVREAFDLVKEFTGKRPRKWNDEAMLMLFWEPPPEWVDLVKDRGYSGTSMGFNWCIFDVSEVNLVAQWKVWAAGRKPSGDLRVKRERVG